MLLPRFRLTYCVISQENLPVALQPLTAAAGRDLQEVVPLKSDSVERHVILEEYEGLIAQAESLKDALSAGTLCSPLPRFSNTCRSATTSIKTSEASLIFSHVASDWVIREFRTAQGREGFVTYIEGLVDKDSLDRHVVAALMASRRTTSRGELRRACRI